MTGYLLRRLAQSVLVVAGVSVIVFVLIRLIPGDPTVVLLGESATEEQRAAYREQLGLDRPVPVQYLYFAAHALRGDLGDSLFFKEPALGILWGAMPETLLLTGASLAFALIVAVPLGIVAAVKRDSLWDYSATGIATIGQAVPPFWLGLMLMYIFAVQIELFPTTGFAGPQYLILPSITLGAYLMALTTRLVRSSMLEVLSDDYIRTARAKGLRDWSVIIRHALPNVLLPVITVVGLQLGALLGGAVITETIFAWPGVGTVVYRAISARDYPLIQASVLLLSVLFVFINLMVDLLYAWVDPRIRYR